MNPRRRYEAIERRVFLGAALALLLASYALAAQKEAASNQTRFATPEEAVEALAHAAQAKDQTALAAIFGPDRAKLLKSPRLH